MSETQKSGAETLLVTGAGGKLGRRVVELLLEQGRKVIAGSRSPEKLADLAAKGAETRRVDFDDPAVASALAGADRMLLISTDALAEPGQRLRQHEAAVAAAEAAGVTHVVYTSLPNPEPGSPVTFAGDHYGTEQALAASTLGWTILRNTWYSDNLLLSLPHALATGQWFTSAGDGLVTHVTREDCARAAAAALASSETESRIYTITGPEALTTEGIAALATEVFGKPIAVIQVSDDDLAKGLAGAGFPDFFVRALVSFDVNTRVGRASEVTDAVRQLTGREPQSLRAFFEANKAAFLPAT